MTILKIMVIAGLVLLVGAGAVFVQAQTLCGRVGWYDDTLGVDCDLEVPSGFVTGRWWLVHSLCTQVEGLTLKTVPPPCISFTFGGTIQTWGPAPGFENTPWFFIGGYATEIGFAYQTCLDGPVVLANFSGFGPTSSDCCEFAVEPGDFQGFQCKPCGQASWTVLSMGTVSYFQGDGTCPCVPGVPAEERTWGGIKALYDSDE